MWMLSKRDFPEDLSEFFRVVSAIGLDCAVFPDAPMLAYRGDVMPYFE
jgi:hypothetical protein